MRRRVVALVADGDRDHLAAQLTAIAAARPDGDPEEDDKALDKAIADTLRGRDADLYYCVLDGDFFPLHSSTAEATLLTQRKHFDI